jgi:hypothetical protein
VNLRSLWILKNTLFDSYYVTSIKHFVYNEIVKYYLGQPSIVIPKDNFQEVYSFKLVEDQVQIAVAYVKYKYNVDLLTQPFAANQIYNDMIKLYYRMFVGVMTKSFRSDKSGLDNVGDIRGSMYSRCLLVIANGAHRRSVSELLILNVGFDSHGCFFFSSSQ